MSRLDSPVHALDVPARVLVTGASSGIGLAMVRQLLQSSGVAQVFAVARSAERNEILAELRATHGDRLQPLSADITLDEDLAGLISRISAHGDHLHMLINCAGVLHGHGVRPEKSLASVSRESLMRVFALNAFAPLLLVKALLPLLPTRQPVVLASLSARVGSIGDNGLGGWYAYRGSKAAQNQLLRTLSIELRRTHPQAMVAMLHPGTVDTPLSKPFQANVPAERLFTADRAAQQLLDIIAGLKPADSGRFIAWDGTPIPW